MIDQTVSDIPIERKMQLIAKMIGSHDCRGIDRDIFHIQHHQYDYHQNLHYGLKERFHELNVALQTFVNEMRNQNKWSDITIIISSDFGRTLTPNSSDGTDHGWSGHSVVMGGSVDGGRILGEYPSNLRLNGPLNVGRGRLIPTRPWESIWSPIIQWMGVEKANELDNVLPNRKSFPSNLMIQKSHLYKPDNQITPKCMDEGMHI